MVFIGSFAEHRRTFERHMNIFTMRFILTIAVSAAVSCHQKAQTSVANLSDGAVIEAIQVAGNRAVPIEAIVAKIQTKAGDKINTARRSNEIWLACARLVLKMFAWKRRMVRAARSLCFL